MTEEAKTPMNVECTKCKHVWPAVYLPLEVGKATAILMALRCPMCAAPAKDIVVHAEEKKK